jgi:hypothetical protein
MRGMHYSRASRRTDDRAPSDPIVSEALAKQAAARPQQTPPKLMPVTPTLPKVRGKQRRRPRA